MNWEVQMDICALTCVKQTAHGNRGYSTVSSAWGSVMASIGGTGVGGGPRGGDIHVDCYLLLSYEVVSDSS